MRCGGLGAKANSLWVYSEASALMSVFPQKNGTEPLSPAHSDREFALDFAAANVRRDQAALFVEAIEVRDGAGGEAR